MEASLIKRVLTFLLKFTMSFELVQEKKDEANALIDELDNSNEEFSIKSKAKATPKTKAKE